VPSQSLDSSDKVSKSGDTMSGPLTLPGAPTLANHAATKAYVDTTSAATGFVLKTGDTMTGDLRATYNDPRIILTKPTGVHLNGIFGRAGADLSRWLIQLGDGTVETGINTGSNFAITRYDDGGFEVDSPISIVRATGVVTIPKLASTAVSGTVTMLPSGTSAGGTSAVLGIGYAGGGTQYGISLRPTTDSTAALYFFNAANSGVGNVTVTSTATSYNTSSDERLKEAFETFDAGRIVDNTEVYSFAWKSTGERSYGVSAQEANETFPQAVTYVKEQDWWGIDYSKYVPVLLQELKTLRARVAELEDKLAVKPS
jgi:hypothetical protein